MNKIKIEDLTVSYYDKPILWDIDLELNMGKITGIIGPNGGGKSTLIKSILNLIKPLSGKILFDNKDYKVINKKISYVPQKDSVNWDFPITVLECVLMGTYQRLGWFKRPSKSDVEKAMFYIKQMELTNYADVQISELSGGQQQRVFLARALTQEAEYYFLDEPFTGVDKKTEGIIIRVLRELRDSGKTIIMVHHDLSTVEDYFDDVVLINRRIIASGDVYSVYNDDNVDEAFKGV